MEDLMQDIESERYKLYKLLSNRELTNDMVIRCSQELDRLIVNYEKNINLSFSEEISCEKG